MILLERRYLKIMILFPLIHRWINFIYFLKVYCIWKWKFTTTNGAWTCPPVIKPLTNNLFFDPSLFENTSKLFQEVLPHKDSLNVGTKLKYQKRDPVLKIVCEWFTEESRPVVETPVITVGPFLLQLYHFFSKSVYFIKY